MRRAFPSFLVLLAGLAMAPHGSAQPPPAPPGVLVLDSAAVRQGINLALRPWRFAPGDDPARAAPGFDDHAWTAQAPEAFDPVASGGAGWFRLALQVAPDVRDTTFVLVPDHFGASALFLDGHLVATFGTPAARPGAERTSQPMSVPLPVRLHPGARHVLALRYSFHAWAPLVRRMPAVRAWLLPGVNLYLFRSRPGGSTLGYATAATASAIWVSVTAGALLLLIVLNLAFFLAVRDDRAALYVAGLAAVLVLQLIVIHLNLFPVGRTAGAAAAARVLTNVFGQGILLGFLLVLYAVFLPRPPRWQPALVALGAVLAVACVYVDNAAVTYLFMFILVVELVRVVGGAIRRRQEGAWIVGTGVLATTLASLLMIAGEVSHHRLMPYWGLLLAGYLPIPTSFSMLLAYRFGRVSRSLRARLVEVEQLTEARAADAAERATLEAESRRKSEELEAARRAQLALLPRTMPQTAFALVAARMRTATEVGGDYYDAHLAPDGTLTLAIGDATGHGAQAGSMVMAAKSLFVAHAGGASLPDTLAAMNATVRALHIRGIFMALLLARLEPNGRLRLAAAGMPLPLIVRTNGAVEEVVIKGLPLGAAPLSFRYAEAEVMLAPGDTLVLVSDGLPERRRRDGAFLGYDALPGLADRATRDASPEEAVTALAAASDAFAQGAALDDDETLLVLRYAPTGTASGGVQLALTAAVSV